MSLTFKVTAKIAKVARMIEEASADATRAARPEDSGRGKVRSAQWKAGDSTTPRSASGSIRRWPAAAICASIAAALLLAIGLFLYFGKSGNQPIDSVVSGEVYANGSPLTQVPLGTLIEVGEREPAVLQLSDGSEAKLNPSSRLVLHGREVQVRQVVELVEGGGTFRVPTKKGQFKVTTSIGEVTVLGTEFSVELLSIGERQMKKVAMMAVVVMSGLVQVDVNGKSYSISGGESEVFSQEGRRESPKSTSGKFRGADASKLTLVQLQRDKSEPSFSFQLDKDTKVLVETDQDEEVTVKGRDGDRKVKRPKLAEGKLADLKKGQRITVTHDADGKALQVLGHRLQARRIGGESTTSGAFRSAAASALTLIQQQRGKGEQSISFKLDKDTKVLVETDQDEEVTVKGRDGDRKVKRPKLAEGNLTDLNEGQLITVTHDANGKALQVLRHRPAARRKN